MPPEKTVGEMHPQRWGDPAAATPLPEATRGLVEMAFGLDERPAVTSAPPGRTTASGASDRSPARARSRSGVDLPRVRSRRVSSSVSTFSGPRVAASRSSTSAAIVGAASGALGAAGRSSAPKTISTRPRASVGSAAARAGSPQRDGCISLC